MTITFLKSNLWLSTVWVKPPQHQVSLCWCMWTCAERKGFLVFSGSDVAARIGDFVSFHQTHSKAAEGPWTDSLLVNNRGHIQIRGSSDASHVLWAFLSQETHREGKNGRLMKVYYSREEEGEPCFCRCCLSLTACINISYWSDCLHAPDVCVSQWFFSLGRITDGFSRWTDDFITDVSFSASFCWS